MILFPIAGFILLVGFGIILRISNRGPRSKYVIRQEVPGYRAWEDDDTIPHPNYRAIITSILLFTLVCSGISAAAGALLSSRDSNEEIVQTIEPEQTNEVESTSEMDPEQTEEILNIETIITETSTETPTIGFLISTPTDNPLLLLPTMTAYPTYTDYPTYTPASPVVERIIVTSQPITIREPAPPPIVLTSPPEVIVIPPIVVTATPTATHTLTVTASMIGTPTHTETFTPTETQTSTSTPTVTQTLTPAPEITADGL